ncbi:TIGR02285 family protein [Undibacterium sp. TS12]|uniref:TIGR02285 family protein n=1 Tax=Undibacterium sp. TS12 TaxID=2908202 RepID=UPI001F4C9F34|nr:TIGR02285 family protein [Undibacterium sp. TS12]MCH8620447.1 TIGR02285 family protein [Undibacterium sp. TS12]
MQDVLQRWLCVGKWARRLALIAGLLASGITQAANEINWYVFPLPPLYIPDGPGKGEGIVDLALQRHLIPNLPDYQHKLIHVPLKRLELMLKEESNACALGLFKNAEREKTMVFSTPFFAQVSPGAMIPRAQVAQLRPYLLVGDKLSLGKLLEDGALTVGVQSGRSYGAVIDELLQANKDRKNIFFNSAPNAAKSLFQMNALGRVNLILGYPYEATFLNSRDSADFVDLKFYPLQEQPAFLLGYAACSKSPFGEQAIEQINAVLARREILEAIASYYESWMPEDARPLARQVFSQAFPVRARARK